MSQSIVLSSYLVQPSRTTHRRSRRYPVLRGLVATLRQMDPLILSRLVVVLMIWGGIVGGLHYAFTPHNLSAQSSFGTPLSDNQAKLAAAAHVNLLPGGPTGQLLPPGTLAPSGTFHNGYAYGQCTWYVASRRPVPGNWGNANTWYSRAQSAGYKVGTLPAIGAIGWTPAGYYGHVVVVESVGPGGTTVTISEMNYRATGVRTVRTVPASSFKYIY